MFCREAVNAKFIVFGLAQPTIYNTQDEHANNYTTNVGFDLIESCRSDMIRSINDKFYFPPLASDEH